MNSLVEGEFPLHETQRLRYDLLQTLTDSDLTYKLPGDNPTLGELCREFGDVEYSYIQSFKTFKHDWSHRTAEPQLATSVARLQAWYTTLDTEFETVVRGFSEDDLRNNQIDRGHGFTPPLFVQFCTALPTSRWRGFYATGHAGHRRGLNSACPPVGLLVTR